MDEVTIDGKKVIAKISLDDMEYYLSEDKKVYEKVGRVYIEIRDEKIAQRVKNVLLSPKTDEFFG